MLPSIFASLGAALLAGLVGSPHCMGMCGGFAMACGGAKQGLPWHLGRLTTYATLGAVAATFGAILPGPSWIATAVATALLLWFAAALAGLVPEPTLKIPGVARLATRAAAQTAQTSHGAHAGTPATRTFTPRYTLGLATGLLPCGLVYAALAIPIAAGDPLTGALSMVAFGAGTMPALAFMAAGARKLTFHRMGLRRAAAALVLTLGLLSVGMRQGLLAAPHAHTPAEHSETPTQPTPHSHENPHGS